MPFLSHHRAGLPTVAAVLLLTLAGCSNKPTAPSPSPTTAMPTSAPSGAMTGDELVWLEGISALHKAMDNVLNNAPQPITSNSMRPLAQQLAACTGTLDRLGSPTERLRPVYELAKQGCTQYEKAAGCFTTAADLGIVGAGSADEQKQKQATDCAFAAPGEGSKLFADAEIKGFDIKGAAR